ncbi:MAG: hypothetical protein AB7D29_04545 [Campylobacterales bacterium]
MNLRWQLIFIVRQLVEIAILPLLIVVAIFSRLLPKKIDVGIGPMPLIKIKHYKKALERYGYSAETFVFNPYHYSSDFDNVVSATYGSIGLNLKMIKFAFKYKVLYIFFNGGAFGISAILWRFEPLLYALSGVKIVVMPYGADVQDLSRSENLLLKHGYSIDYPSHKYKRGQIAAKIDLWSKYADHVIAGCEWVDYMYYWDTLLFSQVVVDDSSFFDLSSEPQSTFVIVHAPNHRALKGTPALVKAVDELKLEGFNIELRLLEKLPNSAVLTEIKNADLVADQFVIGWYGMFAVEAMAAGKPVLCYLREDLIKFYKAALDFDLEFPLINTNISDIKNKIIWAYHNRNLLSDIASSSREFTKNYHSIDFIGGIFSKINGTIGLEKSLDNL